MKLYIFRARLCKAWQRIVTGDSTLNGDCVGQTVLEDVRVPSEITKRPCVEPEIHWRPHNWDAL